MKIHKARLHHATNSSSTHSFIVVDPKDIPQDTVEDMEFGWDRFTASTKESKSKYFGYIVGKSLTQCLGQSLSDIIVKDLIGEDLGDGYVDHQSVFGLPKVFGGKKDLVDMEFVREFKEFFLRDDIVILGGNDNDGETHHLATEDNRVQLPLDWRAGQSVCRRDAKGHWTLFSEATGTKVRLSLDESERPEASTFPELIDIKITDFCATGCTYCYQGSTTSGQHANGNYLHQVVKACGAMKVFEVAIGGGEPTAHPRFTETLEQFRREGVTPSFSTRSLSWARNPKKAHRISEACGSWAFSADDVADIDEAVATAQFMGIKKPVIHLVLGANSWGLTECLIQACLDRGLRMVLLGYKTTGRGAAHQSSDCSEWLQFIAKTGGKVSIDTEVVRQYDELLKASNVPEWLLERKEGAHSMYIDAVAKTMGPSSFCAPSLMEPYEPEMWAPDSTIPAALEKWSRGNSLAVIQ